MRLLISAIAIVWEWITDPFRDEEPMDVPIGLEDLHELSGGRLVEPWERPDLTRPDWEFGE